MICKEVIMKKITTILCIILILTGCQKQQANDTLHVTVSFYPLEYYVSEIGKEHISVFNVLSKGASAHDYEPSIQDRIKIENSDLFIHNGFKLEHWVDKILKTLDNKTVILDSSVRITPLYHDHDHHENDDDSSFNEDPHIWLDPYLAQIQIENISQTLITMDPNNKEDYEKNTKTLLEKIYKLQEAYDENLTNKHPIVLEHEIFSYLEERYEFEQISISGFLPESEPSFQQLDRVIKKIEEDKIDSLLLSKYSTPKTAEVIQKETGIDIKFIDPLENRPKDKDYIEVMYDNLESLKAVLDHE